MSIHVINRNFTLAIRNEHNNHLAIKCSEHHLAKLRLFLKLHSLNFDTVECTHNLIADIPHGVTTDQCNMSSQHGDMFWSLKNGIIHFKPLGGFGDLDFEAPLAEFAELIYRNSAELRYNDCLVGQMGYNAKIIYFYTNSLSDTHITVTDRSSFYATMQNNAENQWTLSSYFATEDFITRITPDRLSQEECPADLILSEAVCKLMKRFPTVSSIYNQLSNV